MRHSRSAIEQELRQRIRDGRYAPGSRLPLRREFLREFGASPLTLQRAMDRLAEQGFIRAQGTRGTFVAPRLPNRSCYALVFPGDPEPNGNRHWRALLHAAKTWADSGVVSFNYYFLTDHILDVPDHRRLCADLADGGLAGVISVSNPFYLAGSPLLESDCPWVCIGGSDLQSTYRASWITPTDDGVHEKVFRWIRASGRRRVGFLTHPGQPGCPWLPLLKANGLTTRPEWWLGIPPSAALCAQPVARLLCSVPETHRPDALMITDDNLVPYATAGVLDAGLGAPQDLAIVAHTNFPIPTHSALPCLRYGMDDTAVMQAAIAEIARLADGGKQRTCTVPLVIQDTASATR